jgi:hypothetical protein
MQGDGSGVPWGAAALLLLAHERAGPPGEGAWAPAACDGDSAGSTRAGTQREAGGPSFPSGDGEGGEEDFGVEVGDEREEGEEGGEEGMADPVLDFDLAARSHLIELAPWADVAKDIAAEIRAGSLRRVVWWNSKSAPAEPVDHLPLSQVTGVYQFVVSHDICSRWEGYLAREDSYDRHGFLRLGGRSYPGYGAYPYVHAPGGSKPGLQERKTTRVHGQQYVNKLLKEEPLLSELVQDVRKKLGLPQPRKGVMQPAGKSILALHFLCQDETQQSSFSWHADDEDIRQCGAARRYDMTTVIVNFSDAISGMRVWGMQPVLYLYRGHAVAFPGCALHESLPRARTARAQGVVRKVALFFG